MRGCTHKHDYTHWMPLDYRRKPAQHKKNTPTLSTQCRWGGVKHKHCPMGVIRSVIRPL